MIAKLQGNEDPKKGAGLEYGYINVRDEYREGDDTFFYPSQPLPQSIQGDLNTDHWNTKLFEVKISNGWFTL